MISSNQDSEPLADAAEYWPQPASISESVTEGMISSNQDSEPPADAAEYCQPQEAEPHTGQSRAEEISQALRRYFSGDGPMPELSGLIDEGERQHDEELPPENSGLWLSAAEEPPEAPFYDAEDREYYCNLPERFAACKKDKDPLERVKELPSELFRERPYGAAAPWASEWARNQDISHAQGRNLDPDPVKSN